VAVRNQQAEVVGEVTLAAGEKTDVAAAAPPAPKAKASAAELEQARALTRASGLDITLGDRQGNRVNLRERVGRVLVVNYWAAWAPPARSQLETLNRLAAEFGGDGVEFVAVAMDSGGWRAVDTFERSLPIRFLVLLDEGNRAAAVLGVQAIPTTLLVDWQGQIVRRWVGQVDAETLRRELRRRLQE
jgi:thiol-disulfide isomerase/thioredoxin